MIVVRNTENVKIKEKMLELKGEDLNLTKLAEIGKMWEATHHNHNQSTNEFTGSVNSLQRGDGPNRRQQQDIVCFICNYKYHMARECKSDRSKMKCTDCGDNIEFRKKPHNTGARFCPKNKPSPADQ